MYLIILELANASWGNQDEDSKCDRIMHGFMQKKKMFLKVLQEPWEQFLKSPYKMKDYTVWRIWILYPDFISCDSQGGIHEALPEDPWFSNFITVVGKKQKHSGPKK